MCGTPKETHLPQQQQGPMLACIPPPPPPLLFPSSFKAGLRVPATGAVTEESPRVNGAARNGNVEEEQ